jgi:tetratricopeptide (TPR) repeat protein
MSWMTSKKASRKVYDRRRILADARRAVGRGKHAKAIALYERIQQAEPDNTDVLRQLAVQRARAGQRDEAWRDCRSAAERLVERGFLEQAIGVYRDFATHLPGEAAVWGSLSQLELARQRPPDAVGVLLEGRRFFGSRRARREALSLLRQARKIDPTHFEANFDLAGLLKQSGAPVPARRILVELENHARGRDLRRLRARLFWLSPGARTGWHWISALVRGT